MERRINTVFLYSIPFYPFISFYSISTIRLSTISNARSEWSGTDTEDDFYSYISHHCGNRFFLMLKHVLVRVVDFVWDGYYQPHRVFVELLSHTKV